jgi:hypothetical protein
MTIAGREHLAMATKHARSTPTIASWLAAVEAMTHADRGDHAAAPQALDRAHAVLSQPAGRPAPAWFHDGGTGTLVAATGHVLLSAGDHGGARDTLAAALGQLRPAARRQRVLLLVDLATAELHSGDLPAACSRATDAAVLLHHAAYATGAARLHAFRTAAAPLNGRALRALDEHLSRIAA